MDGLCHPSSKFCEDKGVRCLNVVTRFSFYFEMSHREVIANAKPYPTVIDTSALHLTAQEEANNAPYQ